MLQLILLLLLLVALIAAVLPLVLSWFNSSQTPSAAKSISPPGIGHSQQETTMSPIEFLGVLGSLITIASAIQDRSGNVTPGSLLKEFRSRKDDRGSEAQALQVSDQDVLDVASMVISIHAIDKKFLDRINNTCIKNFNAAIDDYTLPPEKVSNAFGAARHCVCSNLKMVRDQNAGMLPDEFMDLHIRFQCGM